MTILLLNGVGSAGKTSLTRALQAITREVFLHVQMDAFLAMLPDPCPGGFTFETVQNNGHPEVIISSGPAGKRAMKGMRRSVAALADAAGGWFTEHDNDMTPFMTSTARVVEARAEDLGAVRHVDGTARVQTVTEASAPDLCGLLRRMEARGAPPIVLNTSLNGAGEPIVGQESDALAFFLSHPIDTMVLGDLVVSKR